MGEEERLFLTFILTVNPRTSESFWKDIQCWASFSKEHQTDLRPELGSSSETISLWHWLNDRLDSISYWEEKSLMINCALKHREQLTCLSSIFEKKKYLTLDTTHVKLELFWITRVNLIHSYTKLWVLIQMSKTFRNYLIREISTHEENKRQTNSRDANWAKQRVLWS